MLAFPTITQGCAHVTDMGVLAVAEHCPQLVTLRISKCTVSDEGMFALAERCSILQHLEVAQGKG
jgi:hypothetical protein